MKWAHPPQLPTTSRSVRLRFLAAHFVLNPFELGFVIVAKLQALHRMQRLAVVNSLSERAWSLVMRLSFAAVIAGLLVGAVGNFVAAVYMCRYQNVHFFLNEFNCASRYYSRAADPQHASGWRMGFQRHCCGQES